MSDLDHEHDNGPIDWWGIAKGFALALIYLALLVSLSWCLVTTAM